MPFSPKAQGQPASGRDADGGWFFDLHVVVDTLEAASSLPPKTLRIPDVNIRKAGLKCPDS